MSIQLKSIKNFIVLMFKVAGILLLLAIVHEVVKFGWPHEFEGWLVFFIMCIVAFFALNSSFE